MLVARKRWEQHEEADGRRREPCQDRKDPTGATRQHRAVETICRTVAGADRPSSRRGSPAAVPGLGSRPKAQSALERLRPLPERVTGIWLRRARCTITPAPSKEWSRTPFAGSLVDPLFFLPQVGKGRLRQAQPERAIGAQLTFAPSTRRGRSSDPMYCGSRSSCVLISKCGGGNST